MKKVAASSKFYLPPVLLFLAFLFLPATLWALMGFSPKAVVFKVINATQYRSLSDISLDIEIIKSDDEWSSYFMVPGRRFNVEIAKPQHFEIRIGQTLQGDFSGGIDDLGSGRISLSLDTATLTTVENPIDSEEIPWSVWEPLFEYLQLLKAAFIAFWWLIAMVLVYRPDTKNSTPDAQQPQI